jgi:hypothetical protein
MTNDEAKFLLHAYRPNGADAKEPAFVDALQQAKSDPALGAWFEREQAYAATMAAKLREIAPPPGLREAIVAGARATKGAAARRWIRPAWLAAAALLVVLLSVSGYLTRRASRGDLSAQALAEFALEDTAHGRHGGHGAAAGALQTRLGEPGTRLMAGVPMDFATLKATGCRSLQVAGRDILEVCFVRDGAEFHFYIAPRASVVGAPQQIGPALLNKGRLCCATWQDAAHEFAVVSDAGVDAVRRLL